MKIEHMTCICMFVYAINFELPEMTKKCSFGFFRPNLPQLGLFYPYFECKSSFRVISMITMVIFDQSRLISLILKNKNSKIVNCTFIITHKNGNQTSIQPILKSNSTFFIFNNIFCEMNIKKVIHWGGLGGIGEPSQFHLGSVISVFTWISKYITWTSKQ